jgi:Putative phage tail protein
MTGILGSGSNAKQATAAGSLQFQTSQVGGVIPLVYGATRVACNLLDYQDFTATPAGGKGGKGNGQSHGGGKGGADAKGNGQYTYTASVILGICQGPLGGGPIGTYPGVGLVGLVWYNKDIVPLPSLQGISTINQGADDQNPDGYWQTNHPGNAIGYSGTANFTLDNYQLGYSAALPNFTVEVYGLEVGSSVNGSDANPAAIVNDFLTNPRYGAGFPAANLDISGTIADYGQYCDAAGIWLSPQLDQQTEAQQALQNIADLTVSAIVWSGNLLKIIPYGDAPISATYWLVNISGDVVALDTLTLTFNSAGLGTVSVSYQAQPANVNTDTIDTSAVAGRLAQAVDADPTLTNYGISAGVGVSTTVIRLAGADQTVTVSGSASAGGPGGGTEDFSITGPFVRTWSPNVTVQYSLDDDDFITQESSVGTYLGVTPGGPALRLGAGPITGGFTDDPVKVTRTSPADAMNYVQFECKDRAYSYNSQLVEVFDQGMVDLYGVRKDTSVKATAICDPALCAQTVAQLILQRITAYRNTYAFSLGWAYCLLEPMDLVAISDSYLGIANKVVRITSVTEDEEGTLSFTAEDFLGTAGGVVYGGSPGTAAFRQTGGFAPTASVPYYGAPAPVAATPFILEPTPQLLAAQGLAQPQIVIGLCAPGPIWGGAGIYVSLDDESFGQMGNFVGRSTMGVSTLDLPANGGTSLTVNLAECAGAGPQGSQSGAIASVSPLAAANAASLCALRYPGGNLEFLSFTTATLVSGNTYTLTGLYRGLYGTPIYDQPAGAQFLYLGAGQYYAQTLPPTYVGHNLWFKFPSFNLTGSGGQSLADAAAYEYTPLGVQLNPNAVTARLGGVVESGTTASTDGAVWIENR